MDVIDELQQTIKTCKENETKWNQKAKDLQNKMNDAKGYRDKKLKEAEAEMKAMKQKSEKSRKEWKQREQDYETLNLEISELKKTLETTQQELEATIENIKKLKLQYEEMSSGVIELKVRLFIVTDYLNYFETFFRKP